MSFWILRMINQGKVHLATRYLDKGDRDSCHSRIEQLYQSPARDVTSIIERFEGMVASFSIGNEIRGKGEVELPVSHTTPIFFRIKLPQMVHFCSLEGYIYVMFLY